MSEQQLTSEALALPLRERVSLAQALWESIDAALPEISQEAALREAIRRDQELPLVRQSLDARGGYAGRTPFDRMRLIYHPDAEAELIDAARFYEARVPQRFRYPDFFSESNR